MSIPLLQVDAFAARPFTGNPAAVCILDAARDASWMQAVALEMNLAETAFLVPRRGNAASPSPALPLPEEREGERLGPVALGSGGTEWDLRWFTPAIEVELCGHATLASAHALWETGRAPRSAAVRFHTRSGWLTCTQADGWITMDFPARATPPCPEPEGLAAMLGLSAGTRPVWVGRNAAAYLVVLGEEALVRGAKPDFGAIKRLPGHGIVVTARGNEYDFVSRFFAPGAGIDEDPVTGSAHCALGPYWAERLGKTSLLAYQASARGGVVRVQVKGDRVLLGGQAVTVLRGELV
jgi:PhzF family phenazine biosynthesis protein